MELFWNEFLYRPLLNVLVWLYNGWAGDNLGWAVVMLTATLRLVLLPLSIVNQRNAVRFAKIKEQIAELKETFKGDPVMLKQEIREVMGKTRVSPWAKTLILAIQGLVLVLLYQVFVAGMSSGKIVPHLYQWNSAPGTINTIFFGTDIALRSFSWAVFIGLWLFLDAYFVAKKNDGQVTKGEMIFVITFPLAVFAVMWWLPMVKSLFVLTSLVFSATITLLRRLLMRKKVKIVGGTKKGFFYRIYTTIVLE